MKKQRNCKDKKHLDLIGTRFGRLVVVAEDSKGTKQRSHWLCKCDCGKTVVVRGSALTSGNTKSCGCINFENKNKRNFVDLSGKTFGLLTVTNESTTNNGKRFWKCICACGNISWVQAAKLKNGHTKSCGCIRTSFGEERISQLLYEQQLPFAREYTFNELRFDSGKLARFDFAVFNLDGSLSHLIEYDGAQHYMYSDKGWCTEATYNKTRQHDLIKNEFCKQKRIPLIRIPYSVLSEITINDLLIGSKYTICN